jgi:hypothetical protein
MRSRGLTTHHSGTIRIVGSFTLHSLRIAVSLLTSCFATCVQEVIEILL